MRFRSKVAASLLALSLLAACSGVSSVPSALDTSLPQGHVTKIVQLTDGSGIAFVAPNGQRVVTAAVDKVSGNVDVSNSILGTHATVSYGAISHGTIDIGGGVAMNTTNLSHVTWTNASGTNTGRLDLVNGTYYVTSASLGLSQVAISNSTQRGRITPMDCAGAKAAYVLDGVAFAAALASFAAAPELGPLDYIALTAATAALKNAIDQVHKECQ